MNDGADVRKSSGTSIDNGEYTAVAHARHRTASGTRRLVFFSMAAFWGFSVGVAGLLAAMSAAGQPVHPEGGSIVGLIPALVVAIAGGFIVAAAYKESKRRSR